MENNTIIEPNQISINHARTPWLIRAILTIVLSICGLIPIIATYFMFSIGNGPHIGIIFSYLLFWGLGFYMFRVVLWNSFGKEIIILNLDSIIYNADYKYFKDGFNEIKAKEIEVEIIHEDSCDFNIGRLRIFNQEKEIITVLQSKLSDLEKIKETIKTRYDTLE